MGKKVGVGCLVVLGLAILLAILVIVSRPGRFQPVLGQSERFGRDRLRRDRSEWP